MIQPAASISRGEVHHYANTYSNDYSKSGNQLAAFINETVIPKLKHFNINPAFLSTLPIQKIKDMQDISDIIQQTKLEFKNKKMDSSNNIISMEMFFNEKTSNFFLDAKIQRVILEHKIQQNPVNMELRLHYTKEILKLAESFRDVTNVSKNKESERALINLANNIGPNTKEIDALHAYPYFIAALTSEYEGVNCTNLEEVIELTQFLVVARTLNPNSKEIIDNQRAVVKYIKDRWLALNIEGGKKEDTKFKDWEKKLDAAVEGDFLEKFFRNLFSNNQGLFGRASSQLLDKYPYLERKSDFLRKYPELSHKFQVVKPEPQKAQEVPSRSKVQSEANKENQAYATISFPTNLTDLEAVQEALRESRNTSNIVNFANGDNKKVVNKEIAKAIAEEMEVNPKLSVWVSRQDEAREIQSALTVIFKGTKTTVRFSSAIVTSEDGSKSPIFILKLNS